MRKGCDEEVEKKKRIVKIAVHYRRASQLPEWQPLVPKCFALWLQKRNKIGSSLREKGTCSIVDIEERNKNHADINGMKQPI